MTTILPSSTVYVKYIKKCKYDSYIFVLMHFDKNNESVLNLIKPYNGNNFIYLKEKILQDISNDLEKYMENNREMILKLYFNKFKGNDKDIEYVYYAIQKKGKKYKKILHEVLDNRRKLFLDNLADVKIVDSSDDED